MTIFTKELAAFSPDLALTDCAFVLESIGAELQHYNSFGPGLVLQIAANTAGKVKGRIVATFYHCHSGVGWLVIRQYDHLCLFPEAEVQDFSAYLMCIVVR